jgi:hypothetical protein
MTTNPLHLDVNEQIECAHTLASRFYTDPGVLEIERDKIFRRSWPSFRALVLQTIERASAVRKPGN